MKFFREKPTRTMRRFYMQRAKLGIPQPPHIYVGSAVYLFCIQNEMPRYNGIPIYCDGNLDDHEINYGGPKISPMNQPWTGDHSSQRSANTSRPPAPAAATSSPTDFT